MAKYSFQTKGGKEFIKSINASTYEEAVIRFAQMKVLTSDTFLELYEVIERKS